MIVCKKYLKNFNLESLVGPVKNTLLKKKKKKQKCLVINSVPAHRVYKNKKIFFLQTTLQSSSKSLQQRVIKKETGKNERVSASLFTARREIKVPLN